MGQCYSISDSVPDPNLINEELPDDLLRKIFMTLPVSNLFVAPVCKRFRDLYATVHGDKKNRTYEYSIHSEAALKMRLNCFHNKKYHNCVTSIIGAGTGRRDWVERGNRFNVYTCMAAAAGGQLCLLQWLHGRGCPWDWRTCSMAVQYGHLAVLQWMGGEGCPWDAVTCLKAAANGHLEVLQWLRGEGCPWDEEACSKAASNGHFEVVRWAIENGCPYYEQHFGNISDPDFLEWFGEYKANSNQV
mmetsp:Transcript_11597/g.23108  ORF Transcript_11597/g.23108 Transcript_11597/m.23108 type:complete len:245 (-) Transcript_11597:3-737(-)